MQKWSLWHDRNGNKFVNKTSAMAKMEEDRKKEKVVEEEKGNQKVEKKVEGEEKKMAKSLSIPAAGEEQDAKDKGSRNLLDNGDERESENSKLRRKSLRKKNFVKEENIPERNFNMTLGNFSFIYQMDITEYEYQTEQEPFR